MPENGKKKKKSPRPKRTKTLKDAMKLVVKEQLVYLQYQVLLLIVLKIKGFLIQYVK